jgi:hypothetical protein
MRKMPRELANSAQIRFLDDFRAHSLRPLSTPLDHHAIHPPEQKNVEN